MFRVVGSLQYSALSSSATSSSKRDYRHRGCIFVTVYLTRIFQDRQKTAQIQFLEKWSKRPCQKWHSSRRKTTTRSSSRARGATKRWMSLLSVKSYSTYSVSLFATALIHKLPIVSCVIRVFLFGTVVLDLQFTGLTVVQKFECQWVKNHVDFGLFFHKNCLPLRRQMFTVCRVYAVVVCKLCAKLDRFRPCCHFFKLALDVFALSCSFVARFCASWNVQPRVLFLWTATKNWGRGNKRGNIILLIRRCFGVFAATRADSHYSGNSSRSFFSLKYSQLELE